MLPARVRPWSEVPRPVLAGLAGVLTDIDDTLTARGALMPAARAALDALAEAGVPVIAITGRPQGWSEPFVLDWPVHAIVAENGAVLLRRGAGGRLDVAYRQDAATRAANARRLREVAERIVREVPGACLADDSPGRVTDIAIDHAEHHQLSPTQVGQVVALMHECGLRATVSSIHVNGWIGDHDKPSGARWAVDRLFGRDLDHERERWLYVGDSTNDQAMFERFPRSVGVANLLDFADQLRHWPAWLTAGARGEGFAEVAHTVLDARRAG